MEKICPCCKNSFKTYKHAQQYCSKICGQCKKRQVKIIKKCKYSGCSKTFEILSASTKTFCSTDCQNSWQKYYQLGSNNGNFGRENKWGKHDEIRRIDIKNKVTESWKKGDRLRKHNLARERFKLINGYYPTHSPSAREKISEANIKRMLIDNHLTTFKNCKRGYYFNIKCNMNEYYHSGWEEERMKELDNDKNVIAWTKKHKYILKYKHNGIIKSYLPDFFIEYFDGTKAIEEIKGYIKDIEVFKLKKESGMAFCLKNDLIYRINFMKNYNKYKHLL